MASVALVFGINYQHTSKYQLHGCINDARAVERWLQKSNLYEEVHLYTDEDDDIEGHTTKRGIIKLLTDLTIDSNITRVFLYFACHGSQVKGGADEIDGLDEVLIPRNYWDRQDICIPSNLITDNELRVILGKFKSSVKVSILFDCCHSGSMCDLKYSMDIETMQQIENDCTPCAADITVISSCRDNQVATETTTDGYASGVFTTMFLAFMSDNKIDTMVVTANDIIAATFDDQRTTQIPTATSSRVVDQSTSFFYHTRRRAQIQTKPAKVAETEHIFTTQVPRLTPDTKLHSTQQLDPSTFEVYASTITLLCILLLTCGLAYLFYILMCRWDIRRTLS